MAPGTAAEVNLESLPQLQRTLLLWVSIRNHGRSRLLYFRPLLTTSAATFSSSCSFVTKCPASPPGPGQFSPSHGPLSQRACPRQPQAPSGRSAEAPCALPALPLSRGPVDPECGALRSSPKAAVPAFRSTKRREEGFSLNRTAWLLSAAPGVSTNLAFEVMGNQQMTNGNVSGSTGQGPGPGARGQPPARSCDGRSPGSAPSRGRAAHSKRETLTPFLPGRPVITGDTHSETGRLKSHLSERNGKAQDPRIPSLLVGAEPQ